MVGSIRKNSKKIRRRFNRIQHEQKQNIKTQQHITNALTARLAENEEAQKKGRKTLSCCNIKLEIGVAFFFLLILIACCCFHRFSTGLHLLLRWTQLETISNVINFFFFCAESKEIFLLNNSSND